MLVSLRYLVNSLQAGTGCYLYLHLQFPTWCSVNVWGTVNEETLIMLNSMVLHVTPAFTIVPAISVLLSSILLSASYPWSNTVWNMITANSRTKQFVTFKLCAILSSVMKSCESCSCPTWHDSSLCLTYPCQVGSMPVSHLIAIWVIRMTVEVSQCLCSSNSCFT